MRLVFAGTPDVAVPSLKRLLESDRHEVAAVVTRPDAPAGRGRRMVASPVAQVAAEAGVEILRPARVRDLEFLDRLRAIGPDLCPVVAFGALVPRTALDIPPRGWVNLHFSLLPAWRGAAPVQHAVLAGDEITGASTFLLEEGLDTGPVFGTLTEAVRPTDTSGDLLGRLAISGAELLVRTIDAIADGTAEAIPQPADGVSLAPKFSVDDVRIDWTAPALRVDRLVRAATPAPGAWTTFRGERLKVFPVSLPPAVPGEAPGTGLAPGVLAVHKGRVSVGTGSGPVLLGDVQPAGKGRMAAAAWANGVRPHPGDTLA